MVVIKNIKFQENGKKPIFSSDKYKKSLKNMIFY